MAGYGTNVETILKFPQAFGVGIYNGNVIVFTGEVCSQCGTYLPCAEDNDFHCSKSPALPVIGWCLTLLSAARYHKEMESTAANSENLSQAVIVRRGSVALNSRDQSFLRIFA
jgi:hypothetical protein